MQFGDKVKEIPKEFAWISDSVRRAIGTVLDETWHIRNGIEAYEVSVSFHRGNDMIAFLWPVGMSPRLVVLLGGSAPEYFELSGELQELCEARLDDRRNAYVLNEEYKRTIAGALEQLASNIPAGI